MIKLRRYLILLTLLLMIGTLGCKAKQSGAQSNQNGTGNANANAGLPSDGVSGAKALGRVFRGSINGSKLQMTLRRDGDQLTGTYFYQKVGTDISLKGSINGQGDFTLQEFDVSGNQTGEFKGKWTEPAGLPTASLDGTWVKPSSTQSLSFYATEQIIELNTGLKIVAKEIKEENKKPKYTIDVEYPELTGASNSNADKFNQEAKNLVLKETREFKESESEASAEDSPTDSDMGSDIQIGYNVLLATDSLISVIFDISTYSRGAAHPNGYTQVINFDLKSGRTLKLGDLFKPNSNFLNVISQYSINDLKKQPDQAANEESIEKGAGPDAENFLNWNITRKGLAITFDPYQVASYAEGPKHVIVPYSALKEIYKPDGPLSSVNK